MCPDHFVYKLLLYLAELQNHPPEKDKWFALITEWVAIQ